MIKQRLFRRFIFLMLVVLIQPTYAQESLVFSTVEGGSRGSKVCGEILRVASQRLGIDMNTWELPGARSLIMANHGSVDGELARIKDIETKYPNLIRIQVSCLDESIYLFVKSGKEFPVDGWGSIPPNYVIGHRLGAKFIEHAATQFVIETAPVYSPKQMVTLLDKGRVDGIIGTPEHIGGIISKLGIKGVVMLESPVHTVCLYPYLNKKHAQLIPMLTAVLKEMEVSGEIQKIQERIISEMKVIHT